MKAKVQNSEANFKPFDLVLTIENEKEARTFFHLFNSCENDLEKFFKNYFDDAGNDYNRDVETSFTGAWVAIRDEVRKRNINLFI